MLMASDVAAYLVRVIAKYGDLPCILEHNGNTSDGAVFDPLVDVPIMTIYKFGDSHKETCVLFTAREVEDEN